MPFIDLAEIPTTVSHGGDAVQIVDGAHMQLAFGAVPAGTTAPPDSHANEQITMILKGSLEMRVGNETRRVSEGDIVFIAAWEEHELLATHEDSFALDVFAPPKASAR